MAKIGYHIGLNRSEITEFPSDPPIRGEKTMSTAQETIEELATQDYKYGFVTDVEEDRIAPGLSEDVVRLISEKKNEPEWLLEWRLKAYRLWVDMTEPGVAQPRHQPDRLSEHHLLLRSEEDATAQQHGRS